MVSGIATGRFEQIEVHGLVVTRSRDGEPVRDGPEWLENPDLEAGLFPDLAAGRDLQRLTFERRTFGEVPSVRTLAPHQDDLQPVLSGPRNHASGGHITNYPRFHW